MNTDTILSLISSGQWIPLLAFVLALINTWFSADSAFPITLPSWVRPLGTIVIGQVLSVLTAVIAHQPYKVLAIHAVLAAFLAIVGSHAIFSNGAPKALQALAMLVAQLEGDGDKVGKRGFTSLRLLVAIALVALPLVLFGRPSRVHSPIEAMGGCHITPAQEHAIEQGLISASQIACVQAQAFADPKAAGIACQIIGAADSVAPEVIAFIDSLLQQASTMRAAGYHLEPATDRAHLTAHWVKQ